MASCSSSVFAIIVPDGLGHCRGSRMFGGYHCFLLRGTWKPAKYNGESSSSSSSSRRKPWSSVRRVARASLHFRDSDDDQEMEDVAEMHQQEAHGLPPPDHHRWDVVGLGQAMVDFSGMVQDEFLERLGLEKGVRKIINHEERGKVLHALHGSCFKASAGGSLSNTLVALARLGTSRDMNPNIAVAMTGSVGSDPLGDFYRAKLLKANVHFLSPSIINGTTGTVIVLTTPDAQRTMLSYQGMSSVINFDESFARIIATGRVLVVEGYLWEIPQTVEAIFEACETAHNNGVLVALTASDVSCVTRHRKQFWDLMEKRADILFANTAEAREICGFGKDISPAMAAQYLSHHCPFVSVTDGAEGSYIGVAGEVIYVSPASCIPVDTCGAGDAYAAGILYGILKGVSDLKGLGNLAARVAAVVVGQQGTRLRQEDAFAIMDAFMDERVVDNEDCNTHGTAIGADAISNV